MGGGVILAGGETRISVRGQSSGAGGQGDPLQNGKKLTRFDLIFFGKEFVRISSAGDQPVGGEDQRRSQEVDRSPCPPPGGRFSSENIFSIFFTDLT